MEIEELAGAVLLMAKETRNARSSP
jgi:hypothetical protein